MSELEESKPSAEELLGLLVIQSMRNYDLLAHLLKHFDPERASALVEMHEKLDSWGPFPFLVEE